MRTPGRVSITPATLAVVMRTVPPPVVAVALLAVVPTLVVVASGRTGFAGALSTASVVAGAGVGYAVDDPAAPTLAASPTTLTVRRALRGVLVVLLLGGAWLAALLVAGRYGGAAPDVGWFAAELGASAALAAAFAGRARTDAPVSIGFGAAAAALLGVLAISSFSYRWTALPGLGVEAGHARWWWVVAGGVALAAWGGRDPARRRLSRSRTPGARPGCGRAAWPGTALRRPL